jgi:hypothetical protein
MTKIHCRSYDPKAMPRKIVSAITPPDEGDYEETQLRHRSGQLIYYVTKSAYPSPENKIAETGWCCYCSCVIQRSHNGKMYYGSTGDFQSYRDTFYTKACPDCAPKVERARRINKAIARLEKQLDQIDGLK